MPANQAQKGLSFNRVSSARAQNLGVAVMGAANKGHRLGFWVRERAGHDVLGIKAATENVNLFVDFFDFSLAFPPKITYKARLYHRHGRGNPFSGAGRYGSSSLLKT